MVLNVGYFQSCLLSQVSNLVFYAQSIITVISSQKINGFKMPNSNNRHENERSIFSAKALYGERKVFLLLLYLNKYSISDDVCCASFPPTPVANAEVCTTTNC